MKGDFSRDTFNRHKHFSRVLQQQGRVQLDADTNEQTAILLHYLRTLAADLIGPYGGPVGGSFKISIENNGLKIGKGHYYVDGILCENDKDDATYTTQEDYPLLEEETRLPDKPYLVYLDVWERHIAALEDDDIREKALGGSDTATRAKVVWQVKTQIESSNLDPKSLAENSFAGKDGLAEWKNWIELWQPKNRGCLKARVKPAEKSTEPCLIAPDAKYRGQENQLYRIEIHDSGTAGTNGQKATFKWSKDNGSIVCRIVEFFGNELTVDKSHGFEAKNWVELTNDEQELRGEPGSLVRLIKVEGDRFIFESDVSRPSGLVEKEKWPTKVRRWDQRECGDLKLNSGAVPITEAKANDGWIEIENGIEIQFVEVSSDDVHRYRTGDYWLIPARVATGDIEWPQDDKAEPRTQPPHGVQHHYAPLAVVKDGSIQSDLHCEFQPPECKETT